MKDLLFKKHGRTKINKLDIILAGAFVLFSIISLLISFTISFSGHADIIVMAMRHLLDGLLFQNSIDTHGQMAVISAYSTAIFYFSLLYLVVGSISLLKSDNKERIPGLIASFVTLTGFSFSLSIGFDLLIGVGAGKIINFLPILFIVLGFIQLILGLCAIYYTLNTKTHISLSKEEVQEVPEKTQEEEVPTEAELKEEIIEEKQNNDTHVVEKEEVIEELVKEEKTSNESQEEDIPSDVDNDEKDSDEEIKEEENEDNPYASLGKRRKRIPFENKVKRSKPETRDRYKTIVTGLRKYDFNDRKSIPGEAFSYKKERLIFLTFSGNTLKVYFRLDPKDFINSTIPIKDASSVKKYEDTPSCLIIKSDLASRRVISLAELIVKKYKIPKK